MENRMEKRMEERMMWFEVCFPLETAQGKEAGPSPSLPTNTGYWKGEEVTTWLWG